MPEFQDDPVVSRDQGTAIWGESKTWMGVFGFSESTTGGHGVMGEAVGTGVAGIGRTWLGVYGETRAAATAGASGVWGDGKEGGDGVKGHASGQGKAGVAGFHLTNRGPGIYGEGNPAGRFKGIVEITGGVVVAGVDVTSRIFALERQVSALVTRVAALEASNGPTGPPPPGTANIGVELTPTAGAFSNLRIFGSGFNAGESVAIEVSSVTSPTGSTGSSSAQTTADTQGRINHTMGVSCPTGLQTTHSAFARGVASGRLSNTAGTSC